VEKRYAAVLALLLLSLAAAVQGAPLSVEVYTTDPIRGEQLDYTVTVRTTKELWIDIAVSIYVPGKGWSGWNEIWEGKVYDVARVSKSYYIPRDAGNGSVIIWVNVQYYSSRDYMVVDGEKYYNHYDYILVAGELPCDAATRWYRRYTELEEDCRRLNETYRSLLEEASDLRERNADLQLRIDALVENQSKLLAEKARLEAEAAELREKAVALETMNRILEAGALLAVAAAVGLAAAYATARRHC